MMRCASYFETRRILIFHYQVIVFGEMLPRTRRRSKPARCVSIHFGDLLNGTRYDSENGAVIYNEFDAAMFCARARVHTHVNTSFDDIPVAHSTAKQQLSEEACSES